MNDEKIILKELNELKQAIGDLNEKVDTLISGKKTSRFAEFKENTIFAFTNHAEILNLSVEDLNENRIRLIKMIKEEFTTDDEVLLEYMQSLVTALQITVEKENTKEATAEYDAFKKWYDDESSKHKFITGAEFRKKSEKKDRKEKIKEYFFLGLVWIGIAASFVVAFYTVNNTIFG